MHQPTAGVRSVCVRIPSAYAKRQPCASCAFKLMHHLSQAVGHKVTSTPDNIVQAWQPPSRYLQLAHPLYAPGNTRADIPPAHKAQHQWQIW